MSNTKRSALLHRVNHLVHVCKYDLSVVADILEVSKGTIKRALLDIEAAGLPKPPKNLDLLVYPCKCGKGMMRHADDEGCSQCWDTVVGAKE